MDTDIKYKYLFDDELKIELDKYKKNNKDVSIDIIEHLSDYCLRYLGKGHIKLDITEEQIADRVKDALYEYFENVGKGKEKVTIKWLKSYIISLLQIQIYINTKTNYEEFLKEGFKNKEKLIEESKIRII